MKLHKFVLLLALGCIAFFSMQTVQAQDFQADIPAAYAAYDEEAAFFDEMMYFYFGDEYAYYLGESYDQWADEEMPLQAAAAASAITNLKAVADGPIFVTATWNGSFSSYKVYADGVLKFSGVPFSGATSHTSHLTLSPGMRHTILVVVYDRSGVETGRATAYATTTSNVPTGVTATSGGAGKVTVRWKYLNGMTSYKVYRSADNGSTWITSYTGGGTYTGSEVYTTFSCPTGPYKFAVTAFSLTTGESAKSTPVSFTVQ